MLLATLVLLPAATASAQGGKLSADDHFEIQNLYARYNHAHDSSDAKLLATVFTADGEFVLNGKAMNALGMIKPDMAKPQPQVRHVASSIVINPAPDGARGSSYVILVNLQSAPPAIMGGGYYEDVIVKTPQGWRFKKRTYSPQAAPAPAPAK
jgi:hypothetical protein